MKTLMHLQADQYQQLYAIQHRNQKLFSEQIIGSRRKMFVGNQMIGSTVIGSIDTDELSPQQFSSFLGMFNRNLYRNIVKNNLIELSIDFRGVSRGKNHKAYAQLIPNQVFYNVDLKSAYWQIAHRLGYISSNVFHKYQSRDAYKAVKRLCVSFLARPNKMNYHMGDGTIRTIHCDTSVLRRVYDNIRKELYRLISEITEKIDFIEYNIDGITILPEYLNQVKDYFKTNGLEFKITLCRKIDEYQYLSGSKIKNFRKKLK